jgi:CO/xanthine dehydrogenase FAD-binding subunit
MPESYAPTTLAEALEVRAADPEACPIAGGTDLMVEVNFGHRRPASFLDLTRVGDLCEIEFEASGEALRIGAGMPLAEAVAAVGHLAPAFCTAAQTVGSPQIRARATVGGNLGTASPAGDVLVPLVAAGASVELATSSGARAMPIGAFLVGPKRNALEADELIVAVRLPTASGGQQFAKIGTRNAMVIAVAAFGVHLDARRRSVGTAIGSAGPTTLRAPEAETFLAGVLDEEGLWERSGELSASAAARFGELVAAAARPIDDVRGTAAYRRHALAVLARRTATWAVADVGRAA